MGLLGKIVAVLLGIGFLIGAIFVVLAAGVSIIAIGIKLACVAIPAALLYLALKALFRF